MVNRRPFVWLLSVLVALALIASACGGDDDDNDAATATTTGDLQQGGTLVVGAEQEPDCTDWIASCAGSSWGTWTMQVTTLPRPFNTVKNGGNWEYEATDLLEGEPELKTSPKQVVTYKINPKAVWSDGTKITAEDFRYTWDQIANGNDIYDKTGYSDIESVDTTDPASPVVTFKKVYADWKGIFAGNYSVLPSHLLKGKDRSKEMASGYTFSGGPWKIESWQKGSQATLIRNDAYWGTKAKLDKVVFRFITDTAAEFQAFKAGETSVIYPQPQPDVVDQVKAGLTGFNSLFTAETGNLEALWYHNGKPPFNDIKVRQAWGYAIDRDALVERLFGPLGVKAPMQTLDPPILEEFTDTEAWSDYKPNLPKVNELMTSAGWTKGADGIWAKGGQKFTAVFKTTTGNKRRELTQQILQQQLKAAGFEFTISNQKSGDLFGDQLPKGDFQVALYAQVLTSITPSNCNLFCSKNIPTAPGFSGQNWQRVNIPAVDPLLDKVDNSLDDDERATSEKAAMKVLAENSVSLPLDPLPNILLWSKKVAGPLGDNPTMGPFWNMHLWGLVA